jgi:alpha-mannosidase
MARRIGSIERRLRDRHGIRDDNTTLLFLGMDAHMDWDWLNTFQDLVFEGNGPPQGSVQTIIKDAWSLMIASQGETLYPYAACEMGFLRAALQMIPGLLSQFHEYNLAQQLSVEGGGITSPDNLLSHGEVFIRNYLLGSSWLGTTLGLSSSFAYMPDDFGHDAQLPVVLAAMGFSGVSFSRLPGSWGSSQKTPVGGGNSLWQDLMAKGADFVWKAKDGSTVQAHMLQNSYSQGKELADYCGDPSGAVSLVQGYLQANQASSPAPYVYVPCGNDFALPIPCLIPIADAFNAKAPALGVTAVVATLPEYMAAVAEWVGDGGKLETHEIDPTPYWTGFYASRPALKILHHAAARALLGAEVFGAISDTLKTSDALAWAPVAAARRAAIAQGWEAVVPSTHHDYVTGTAVDSVYTEEQRPLLETAVTIARGAGRAAIAEIATVVGAAPGSGEVPVAVFNSLGFARSGTVAITAPRGTVVRSVRDASGTHAAVQALGDDRWLFQAEAPSFGYATYYLSDQAVDISPAVSATASGDTITLASMLASAALTAVVSRSAGFGITSLVPIVSGVNQPDLVPEGAIANQLVFYEDLGNIYQFGNELGDGNLTQATGSVTTSRATIVENGPLRARIQAEVSFDDGNGATATYLVEYALVAGEPFLRMAITGAVPLPTDPTNGGTPYAVMVRFPLATAGSAATVDGVLRGTPYHWYDKLPVAYWSPPTFQAAHHFVVPSAAGTQLAGFYHRDVPAWAIDGSGAMIACILRNTPGTAPWPKSPSFLGANGVDFGSHRRTYALRVPQGLTAAPALLPMFQESWSYATPLRAALVGVPSAGVSPQHPVDSALPATFSLAQVTSGNAILTVAKSAEADPSALVLRLYQPSDTSQSVTIALASQLGATTLTPITALERPIDGAQPVAVSDQQATVTMDRAIATFAVSRATKKR